ncbi:hypothetical protein [Amycolatopsis echigonensis]|uniref:hypothetical protein n=1 Tax=Amycolatopsis echigonensis TaxID=2576905 RepID=UPI001FE2D14A|nr:hypothetical protein [Amycolatopsis echigonensis]
MANTATTWPRPVPARSHPDPLVVVAADHEHTSQIIANDAKTPGQTATLIANEGANMALSYGTALPGSSMEHTGTQVRIAASGRRRRTSSG